MKKIYQFSKFAIPVVLMITFIANANAQRIVEVPGLSVLSDVIHGDTTATGERVDDNTVYMLERDSYYTVPKAIGLEVPLQIKGADGDGVFPIIVVTPSTTGSYDRMIVTKGDLHLENVYISNQGETTTHGRWGGIRTTGPKTTATFKNCYIEWDLGALIQVRADSMTIILENVRGAKFGGWHSGGGNGRVISIRDNYTMLKLEVRNCTFYHMTDRLIRNMSGGTFDTLIWDHNTTCHIQGYNGSIQIGRVGYCQITNNIFQNPQFMGDHTYLMETTGPEPDKLSHWILTLDEILDKTELNIHHNNFFTDQVLLDFFETVDTTSETPILAPIIKTEMGADTADAFFVEELVFTSMPPMPMEYLTVRYNDPLAEKYPDNFADEIGIFNIDASYPTTSASYTAAEDGGPIGDLNWWDFTGVRNLKAADCNLSVYPNPVGDVVNFEMLLTRASDITLNIFDITGKAVVTRQYSSRSQGTHKFSWDISDANLSAGIYFFNLQTNQGSSTRKIIVK